MGLKKSKSIADKAYMCSKCRPVAAGWADIVGHVFDHAQHGHPNVAEHCCPSPRVQQRYVLRSGSSFVSTGFRGFIGSNQVPLFALSDYTWKVGVCLCMAVLQ